MEAIGGQGANSAGKILASSAVLGMHYTGNHFSSFGSEKRGTPVRSFVRFSTQKKPVRTASFIKHPDVLLIFHEEMMGHAGSLDGCTETTDVIINSARSAKKITFPKNFVCRTVSTLNASKISQKQGCGLNSVMLGAASAFIPEIKSHLIKEGIRDFFSRLSPEILDKNLVGFEVGSRHVSTYKYNPANAVDDQEGALLPRLGYNNAPLGGAILNPGNTVLKDNSVSRKGVMPQFLKDACINCGFCDMVCPDYCFVWQKDPAGKNAPVLLGIDYQYCKGCQKCTAICPVDALTPVAEEEIPEAERLSKLFPFLKVSQK